MDPGTALLLRKSAALLDGCDQECSSSALKHGYARRQPAILSMRVPELQALVLCHYVMVFLLLSFVNHRSLVVDQNSGMQRRRSHGGCLVEHKCLD